MFGASYWSKSEKLDGDAVVRIMDKNGSWQDIVCADFNLKKIRIIYDTF